MRIRPTYPTLKSGLKRMCPICVVNKLGVFRNQCKICGREVCYKCLHPKIKWLCIECGKCSICRDGPGLIECKNCGKRTCFFCSDTQRTCIECGTPDLTIREKAKLVVLTPETLTGISNQALHHLEEEIRTHLLATKPILWKGKIITSLGTTFRVRCTQPNTKVEIVPTTKIIARNTQKDFKTKNGVEKTQTTSR